MFLKEPLNIIDFLAILPFFLSILFNIENSMKYHYSHKFLKRFIDLGRILKILRVFKLARYSRGLRTLAKTLQQNNKELGLMIMFLSIGVFFFSGLVYYFGNLD